MSEALPGASATATAGTLERPALRSWWRRPATAFAVFSILFGLVTIVVTPPFRGPDEPAHFLRAYSYAAGDFAGAATDAEGHRGTLLPAHLAAEVEFFRANRYRAEGPDYSYADVFAEFRRRPPPERGGDRPPVLVVFSGSESYSPGAYLPYIPAAFVARLLDLDFLPTFYLMRLAGLVALTAVIAMATAIVPYGRWAFVLIAMLPASLYGRAMLSADGAVLGTTMMLAALCLSLARNGAPDRPWQRSLWMVWCLLTKPPQIAFVLLEAMTAPLKSLPQRWRTLAIVMLPGIVLSLAWAGSIGGDMGTWRMTEGGEHPAEQFQIGWKLRFMAENPLHFPQLVWGTLTDFAGLWQQVIGLLGWLDTELRSWIYPVISVLLALVFCEAGDGEPGIRLRVAVISALSAFGYFLALCLIFYLAWTPISFDRIAGMQGRYFIVMLPSLAICAASLLRRGLPETALAGMALAGAIVSGAATIDAIARHEW